MVGRAAMKQCFLLGGAGGRYEFGLAVRRTTADGAAGNTNKGQRELMGVGHAIGHDRHASSALDNPSCTGLQRQLGRVPAMQLQR
eukprot:350436-Chlamydomonas_euryale.AAC.15